MASEQRSETKRAAQQHFIDALARLFAVGISEQPTAVAESVYKGLAKGMVTLQLSIGPHKLQCNISRASAHEIQLFSFNSGYEHMQYSLAETAPVPTFTAERKTGTYGE